MKCQKKEMTVCTQDIFHYLASLTQAIGIKYIFMRNDLSVGGNFVPNKLDLQHRLPR